MTEPLQFSMAQREAIVAALGTSAGFVTDFVGALEQVRDLQNVSFTEQVSRLSRFLPAVPEPKRGVKEKDIEELKSQAAEADELNRKKQKKL